MLKSREELEVFLEKQNDKIALNNESCEKIRNYLLDKYKIPTGMTMDMIARSLLKNQTDFILYCMLDGIDFLKKEDNTKDFFTKIEIEHYNKETFKIDTITFPIKIKCEEVTKDQWIGVTDTKFFMDLRRAQLIKYNVNAQRVLKRIVKGENILFKIVPNKLAIKSIKNLMKKREYVPTVITLNIPYDSDADFYYNEATRELVINKIESFDISDGYHRYLAMCEAHDEDKEFNYPMELRIINFLDEKTKQFIFQEDQKTKMSQTNSNAMNINRPSNLVIDRLNELPTFDFKGQIGLNSGTINYAELSDVIELFYFKDKKEYSPIEIRKVRDDVRIKMNTLAEYYPEYITRPFNVKELVLVFHVLNTIADTDEAMKTIQESLDNKIVKSLKIKRVSKATIKTIQQLL